MNCLFNLGIHYCFLNGFKSQKLRWNLEYNGRRDENAAYSKYVYRHSKHLVQIYTWWKLLTRGRNRESKTGILGVKAWGRAHL